MDASGLTWERRCILLHTRTLWALRLLGNTPFTPGPLPSHLGPFSGQLVRALVHNSHAVLKVASSMQQQQRLHFNTRSAGSDAVEGYFAEVHSSLGKTVDGVALRDGLKGLDVQAGLAAQTEAERGFAMVAHSKSYSCRGVAADAAAFNNGSDLNLERHRKNMGARARRTAGSSAQPHVRCYHARKH
ncbi:hypothetical protein N2152v2_003865 [Parachlorella kessleri]